MHVQLLMDIQARRQRRQMVAFLTVLMVAVGALLAMASTCQARDYVAISAAITAVESNGDPSKVGDRGRAVGVHQCWPVQVAECNRIAGRRVWTLADRRCPWEAQRMLLTYLRAVDHRTQGRLSDVELAARWRNPDGRAPRWHVAKLELAMRVRS